jgi:hypothetical protein
MLPGHIVLGSILISKSLRSQLSNTFPACTHFLDESVTGITLPAGKEKEIKQEIERIKSST